MCPKTPSFSDGSGSAPFSLADFPWEMILALGFAHLVTLHHILLFIPNSSPWLGIDSCAVLLPSDTFTFIFHFAVVVVLYLPFAFSLTYLPCPSFLLSFIFLPRKTWLRYQKKMKLQKLKFKKKTLKKHKKILNDSFSFINIFHCFLRLVSRSL